MCIKQCDSNRSLFVKKTSLIRMTCMSAVVSFCFSLSAQNQKDTTFLKMQEISLDEVSVFGYSPTQLANQQPYNITAIDVQKLHNSNADISQILGKITGARLRETGGLGSDFDLSIHGFSGKRIKYFIDGVPMDNFGPAFQINNIPVNYASRIEVYKGVIPVWLGSDALGGAVNIVTNEQMKKYVDVSYSYGSFNTHRSAINIATTSKSGVTFRFNAFQNYSDNDYKMTVDVADLYTGEYYPNRTVHRFHDKYHNETMIAKFGVLDKKWADQLLVGITLGKYYQEIQTGARITAVYGQRYNKGNIVMPSLQYKKRGFLIKNLDLSVNANYNFGAEQSIDTAHVRYNWLGDFIRYRGKGGEQWYSHYKYRDNAANASLTATYRSGEHHYFAVNSVYSHFDRKGSNLISPDSKEEDIPKKTDKNILGISYQYKAHDKWNATLFTKYLYQRASTTLIETSVLNPLDTVYTPAVNNSDVLGFGLTASYYLTPELQLKFSYEKTNRMPESEDIFGDMVNKEGNWEIEPESSHNFNIGASYNLKLGPNQFYMNAAGVYYYTKNFIHYIFDNYTNKLKAANLLNVSNLGAEAEFRYSYKQKFTAGINGTYQNIRDRNKYRIDMPGKDVLSSTYKLRVPNIPYLFGNADASYYITGLFDKGDKLTLSYHLLYVHSFYLYWSNEGAKDTKRVIPQQMSHDINIVYALKNGRYNVSLECRNITDNKLYDNFSLQKPGRSFNIKLRYFINKN